ncbi:unnamed protein product [Meganyctiphanes norvegica]|uniref:Uncharacterized protein n=1 Tax=Meganyctiphanes norvegica TaxID=48144 RepID=A0AAV2QEP9_MEGNR
MDVDVLDNGVDTGPTCAGSDGESKIDWPDVVVIILYFAFVLGVGLWSSRRSKSDSVSGYFLAGRNMHWIPVGASLFASNIGSGHFIGLAGSGASSGIGVAGFENSAVYILHLLGWLFVPVYMASGVYTMPEYLRERFGGQRIRIYLSFLALLLYIFTKISADLYAGALFIQLALNKTSTEWLYISILILLGIAAAFTIGGGLTAVIWTDFVQTILMIIGAFILMVISLGEVGGYEKLVEGYPKAVASIRATDHNNNSCGEPPKDYMNLLRSPVPGESDLPWTGMVFGLTINSIWYWCTDQVIVQRTLASKNMINAKAGCIFAGYLKFLPMWLLVIPGMASRILFTDRVACADPAECMCICGSAGGCSNIAYTELVLNLMPTGLAGLMLAVMMAALMSSLTSIFNSASTIFTIDVWIYFRRRFSKTNPSDTEQLIVGRVFVLVLVAISIIWIPVIQNSGTSRLFDYIQAISSFLAPPICAVYLLAMFWERTNEPGAFWGLMVGFVIGMIRFIAEFAYSIPTCGSDEPDLRPAFFIATISNIHYLHFSIILWIITGLVTIAVSLMTDPIDPEYLYRLTWWTKHSTLVRRKLVEPETDGQVNPAFSESTANGLDKMVVEEPTEELPGWKRILNKLCGVSTTESDYDVEPEKDMRSEEQKAIEAAEFLIEDPKWSSIVNTNAIICLCLTSFIVGYFA